MDRGSMKLSLLLVLLVFASFLSSAEARQNHVHHINNGHHSRVKISPLTPQPLAPTTAPTRSLSPNDGVPPPLSSPDDHVSESEPPYPTPPRDDNIVTPPPYDGGVPYNSPPWYETAPPYVTHGCGYPCVDSNDCDWPCTVCCWNQTCCYDWPEY